jgi:hypothetical protein
MGVFIDIAGKSFGRFTVMGRKDKKSKDIRSGHTKSCGCITKKHGLRPSKEKMSPEYRAWRGMRDRCNNIFSKDHKYYGGKNIKICERWNDFSLFLLDMGYKPTEGHSIDRIDSNGDYEPNNCRWATVTEQNRNRTNIRKLTYKDKCLYVPEWAELTCISADKIHKRIKRGWGVGRALGFEP